MFNLNEKLVDQFYKERFSYEEKPCFNYSFEKSSVQAAVRGVYNA